MQSPDIRLFDPVELVSDGVGRELWSRRQFAEHLDCDGRYVRGELVSADGVRVLEEPQVLEEEGDEV